MSAMANTTPLVTTVTKPATNPRDADATPRVNIQEFCEEYYEDILPIIMDKKDQVKSNFNSRYGLIQKWIEAKAVATITGGQSNGLVERANRSLGEGIKAHLGEGNKNRVEELPHVLWAHRIMIKSSHGDTPFCLTYGTEAIIPTEIGMPMYCTAAVDVVSNDEELRLNLDLLEERHERAAICEAKAK
nr:reverse transcriptase domain-containing protein [Tanacetum cinerariifolium]